MNPMMERGCVQEYIYVRRQSYRIMGKGSGKEYASFSKAIDIQSFGILASITAQPVCLRVSIAMKRRF